MTLDPFRSLRIVVAEDEAIIRLDLVEMLAEEGYEVVAEAGRGDEALQAIRSTEPDLALLDVNMPGVDGLTAAAQIVEEGLCGVIILTAFSDRDLIARATDAGVMAYLVKPFQKPELIAAIEVAHARFVEAKTLRGDVADLSRRLESRKLIDRAKALLQERGMTEAESFSHIQRLAMDRRSTMAAVAQSLLVE